MSNEIKIIFNENDLQKQENLDPKNLKIYFGDAKKPDPEPNNNCATKWEIVPGNQVDINCGCNPQWIDVHGDQVDIDIKCENIVPECDNSWKDYNGDVSFDCECTDLWENKDSVDFNVDCSGSSGGDDFDLGTIKYFDGQDISLLIYGLEIFTATDGQVADIKFTPSDNALLDVNIFDGQEYKNQLETNSIIYPSIYSGEVLNSVVNFVPSILFDISVYAGEDLQSFNVYTEYSLPTNVYDGSTLDSDIKYYPAIDVNFSIYDGSTLSVNNLDISRIFPTNIYDGQAVNFELFRAYTSELIVNVYDGQFIEAGAIAASPSFNIFAYDGSIISYLNVSVTSSFTQSMYDGSGVDIKFYEQQNFKYNLDLFDGQTLDNIIYTEYNLPIDAIEGQTCEVDMLLDPYLGFPCEMYSGETGTLDTISKIYEMTDVNVLVGETVNFEYDPFSAFRMDIDVLVGETVNTKPMFTIIFDKFNAYAGENVNQVFDTLGNYVVAEGQTCEVVLSYDPIFEVKIEDGHDFWAVVSIGKPVDFDRFIYFDQGETCDISIVLTIPTTFRLALNFADHIDIDTWDRLPSVVDLNRVTCVDYRNELKNIELDDAHDLNVKYDGFGNVCDKFIFELATSKTFKTNMYDGQSMRVDTSYFDMTFNVYSGESVYIRNTTGYVSVDLDSGNLIPDGNITIEIDRPNIPVNERLVSILHGETSFINFGASYAVSSKMYAGDNININLSTYEAIRFYFYSGEYMSHWVSYTYGMTSSWYDGQTFVPRIYEVPYECYGGESVKFELDVKSNHNVEFTMSGCLDNNYTYVTENGQASDPSLTSIEGEKFLAFIERRCF